MNHEGRSLHRMRRVPVKSSMAENGDAATRAEQYSISEHVRTFMQTCQSTIHAISAPPEAIYTV